MVLLVAQGENFVGGELCALVRFAPSGMYDDLSLDDLKRLAEERGIKKPRVGWQRCCPPNGNRPDIIKALDRLEQDLIGPMSKLSIVPQVSPRQTTWTAEEETCAHHHPAHKDDGRACTRRVRACLHARMCV